MAHADWLLKGPRKAVMPPSGTVGGHCSFFNAHSKYYSVKKQTMCKFTHQGAHVLAGKFLIHPGILVFLFIKTTWCEHEAKRTS